MRSIVDCMIDAMATPANTMGMGDCLLPNGDDVGTDNMLYITHKRKKHKHKIKSK